MRRPTLALVLVCLVASLGACSAAPPAKPFAIDSPSSGTVVPDKTVTIVGTGPEGRTVTEEVLFAEVRAQVDAGGTWRMIITLKNEGLNNLTFQLDDEKKTEVNLQLTLNTPTPPPTAVPTPTPTAMPTPAPVSLRITSPAEGATVNTEELTISGTGPPGTAITQDVSFAADHHTTASSDGTWSMVVTLHQGANHLRFRVGDDQSTSVDLNVSYAPSADATPPPETAAPTVEPAGDSDRAPSLPGGPWVQLRGFTAPRWDPTGPRPLLRWSVHSSRPPGGR